MRLEGKVAIITGSGNGIGKRIARLFAAEGACVVVADILDDAGQGVVDRIIADGGLATYVHTDILLEEDLRRLISTATETFGRLDILVNNAMVVAGGTLVDTRPEDFDRSLAGMPRAAYLACKYAIPAMSRNGGGSIICMGSIRGLLAASKDLPYNVGKATLPMLCRQITIDYGPLGIRANVICPGEVQSHLEDDELPPDSAAVRFRQQWYPLRRLGWPRDIANAALFFASDESSWISGQTLVVDGGLTIQSHENLSNRLGAFLKENPGIVAGL